MFFACNNSDENVNVSFYLTDAPTEENYQAVHIDIRGVGYSLGMKNGKLFRFNPVSSIYFNTEMVETHYSLSSTSMQVAKYIKYASF